MTTFPSFDQFEISVTQADVDASQQGPAFIQPGTQTLEVLDVEYKGIGENQKDKSWVQFNIYLGLPGTAIDPVDKWKGTIKYLQMVPTKDLKYNGGMFPFVKLGEFFAAFGESLTVDNAKQLIPQYFSNADTLKGVKVSADVAYKGDHIALVNGKYSLCNVEGTPLTLANGVENSFAKRAQAKGQALGDGIKLQGLEVAAFQAGEKQRDSKPKRAKASSEW